MLDDLSWAEEDERETVELTMPVEELTELLRRLHDEATASLTDPPMIRPRGEGTRRTAQEAQPPRPGHLREAACGASRERRCPIVSAAKRKRLRPGELDGLVLSYMREHRDDGPLTASTIGKGIDRSAGATANCLARLAKNKQLRQAKRKPRAYALKAAK